MKITCNKCGHTMEMSNADVQRLGGDVVCPNCLSAIHLSLPKTIQLATAVTEQPAQPLPEPKPTRPRAARTAASATPPPRRNVASPPPYSCRRERPVRLRNAQPRQAPIRKSPMKSNNKRNNSHNPASIGYWGCAWRSALITAAAWALYAVVGLLFQ